MRFLNRIRYFGFGFVFGLVFVFFIFKDRDFKWAWLPGNRVTNFIIDHPIKLDSTTNNPFINLKNFTNDFYTTIIDGEVDFTNSDTKSHIKHYVIKHLNNKIYVSVSFKDSISQIIQFNEDIFSKKNFIDNKAPNLNMDNKTFLNLIDNKEKKFNQIFLCQLEKIDVSKTSLENSLKTLKINWKSSKPFTKPYGFYIGEIMINKNAYYILLEKGAEKTRFKYIQKKTADSSQKILSKNEFNKDCK